MNLLSWGGAYGNSHLEAYAKPFEAETGIKVTIADADNPVSSPAYRSIAFFPHSGPWWEATR